MTTLTHLSDAELDEVTGGFGFRISVRDVNVALVSQDAANVASYTWKTSQSIYQAQGVSIVQSS